MTQATDEPTKMYFVNNEHHDGLNVTVRLGDKWAKRVGEGDHLQLVDLNDENVDDFAVVTEVHVCELQNCSTEWLVYEHSPQCRTLEGLHQALMEIYGEHVEMNGEKLWKQPVTMIGYVLQDG